jgi:diguanylate cyclase (GGDEF)-like protein/PAS domain S-box-containing protein
LPDNSKRIITVSISLLATGVFLLTGNLAWNAYRELGAAERVALVNTMADKLIRTASLAAAERGLTSAALGRRLPDGKTRGEILEIRKQTDAVWNEAVAIAREVTSEVPPDSAFPTVFNHAMQEHLGLEQARQRVDSSLEKNEITIDGREWITISRHFIEDTARLREAAFTSSDMPREVSQSNLIIKHRAWIMSEYAGMERGVLAFYISRRLPVPASVLDDLRSYRGVVEQTRGAMRDLMDLPDIDPRIKQAITAMEQESVYRFDKTRSTVYAAAATGRYPLSAERWMDAATASIDSILAVVGASSQIIDGKMRQAVKHSRNFLVLNILLLIATSVTVAISIARVRKTANTLFREKELAEVTLHSIGDAVITTDAHGNVDYLNPIAETLTGWQVTEAKGRPLSEVFVIVNGVTREPQINPVEKCLRENRIVGLEDSTVLISRHGMERVIEDSAAPVCGYDGKVIGAVMVFYDVTLMRNSPHLLSHQATHDALTGLINRREFERRLATLVESTRTKEMHHVLCYMDLDQFKIVNDTCGHIAGDKLLRQLAFLLMNRVRNSDTLARLGGDEFGVLLESCPMEPALRLANDLIRIVNDFRFVWEGTTFEIGVSIGMVPITPESTSPVELMSQADSSCYAAKDRGRNRVHVYEPEDAELQQRKGEMQWVSRIRQAIEQDRFVLYCHTILPLKPNPDNHRYCETLLRMIDESGNIVPPMAFLPAAERYGLMPAIDRWVIRKALALFAKHCREHPRTNVNCFINLSGASLSDGNLFEFVRDQIQANDMRPESVCFEITETAAVAHLDTAVVFMRKLKELGCRFALDDFGSGMSSFAYLKNLPVDYLKIDGSFVRNIANNPVDYAMVGAINGVGHTMGIKTIAEFVEDAAILEKLKELGVDFAQGFGIAKPEPMIDHLPTQTPEVTPGNASDPTCCSPPRPPSS